MKPFLEYVAEDLLAKHGSNLSRIALVFPNKRAALFLSEYLARKAQKPIWSPNYITISELFRKNSSLQVADPIKLVSDLHKSFVSQTGIDETLDHFFGWGQLLITDFDDIDKNMADADKLFANISNIHELDDLSYLTEEQKSILAKFFSNFTTDHQSELKKRFMQLWSKMGNIYNDFNLRLSQQQLAYEGALYREVVESGNIQFDYDRYVFVGFNLLHKVEQKLFSIIKKEGHASFYWDFDRYYMPEKNMKRQDSMAGYYIAQYLSDFPNELDIDRNDIYNNFAEKRTINIISAPTENAQARYISSWLLEDNGSNNSSSNDEKSRIADGHNTSIVLCNEALLQSVIHCLPDEVSDVNITTGYPLIQSPAASLVNLLFELQTTGFSAQHERFRLKQIKAVLNHPYTRFLTENAIDLQRKLSEDRVYYASPDMLAIDEGTTLLFKHYDNLKDLLEWLSTIIQETARNYEIKDGSNDLGDPLIQETLFKIYTLLNRLNNLVDSGDLLIDLPTLQRLIIQLFSSSSVPFHGEPINGIQIMGVLETRNLDFNHLLILSCNEGNMPKGSSDTSFIPYSIRKAFGLTTIDHKVAIYSYYFHRLIQRAKDVTFVYNNATTDGHTAEMSRFLLQLMVESPHDFRFYTLQSDMRLSKFMPTEIEKSDKVMQKLLERFDIRYQSTPPSSPLLTPSAINRFMRCQLNFYYYYICGLKEDEENDDDRIDNKAFGNIFHDASYMLYKRLTSQTNVITASALKELLKNGVDIERAVDDAIQKELFKNSRLSSNFSYKQLNGLQIINREVIIHYVRQLISNDEKLAPFSIVGLENDVQARLDTDYISTLIGGRVDRMDKIVETNADGSKTERIRVIDYKTGKKRLKPLDSLKSIFLQDSLKKHSDYYLQAFLYSCIISVTKENNPSGLEVSPALLFIQHATKEDYDPTLFFGKTRINSVEEYRLEFGRMLREVINEIFNKDVPFKPTEDRQRCEMCPYKLICR